MKTRRPTTDKSWVGIMEQTYDCCPVLTEFVLLDNVLSNLDAPVDILAASHGM